MNQRLTLEQWLDSAISAASSLGQDVLACPRQSISIDPGVPANDGLLGSYVSLNAGSEVVHVGLISTESGCEDMTRILLCLDEGDPLADEDIVDAVNEMTNILAGLMSQKLNHAIPDIELGLPSFSRVERDPVGVGAAIADARFGHILAKIVVLPDRSSH